MDTKNTNNDRHAERLTAMEELYQQIEKIDKEFKNAQMVLDWIKENKQIFIDKEKKQLDEAWIEGAVKAQSDAAEEIKNNYKPRKSIGF